MHEAGLAQNVLRIVEDAAQKHGLSAVAKIVLEIGQFSGVQVEALDFAFSVIRDGTILERADIEYQTPPLVLRCATCEAEYLGDPEDLRCPVCLGTRFEVVQGRELVVRSIAGGGDDD